MVVEETPGAADDILPTFRSMPGIATCLQPPCTCNIRRGGFKLLDVLIAFACIGPVLAAAVVATAAADPCAAPHNTLRVLRILYKAIELASLAIELGQSLCRGPNLRIAHKASLPRALAWSKSVTACHCHCHCRCFQRLTSLCSSWPKSARGSRPRCHCATARVCGR